MYIAVLGVHKRGVNDIFRKPTISINDIKEIPNDTYHASGTAVSFSLITLGPNGFDLWRSTKRVWYPACPSFTSLDGVDEEWSRAARPMQRVVRPE